MNENTTIPKEENERKDITGNVEGVSEENARDIKLILQRFMKSYNEKSDDVTDEEWLAKALSAEMPEESSEVIQSMNREIMESITKWRNNIQSINDACAHGATKESWLADKIQEAAVGMNEGAFGKYLADIDAELRTGNQEMINTILTQRGTVSMNPNLDGFIGEQKLVNSFNRRAVLIKSPYRAKVLKPAPGKPYGKNSVDIVIIDTKKSGNNIVLRYQVKLYRDAKSTFDAFNNGDYRQRAVVAEEFKDAVQALFKKSGSRRIIFDRLESPDKLVQSCSYSKKYIKSYSNIVQKGKNVLPKIYKIREYSLSIGQNVVCAGLGGVATVTGYYIASKVLEGEKIKADDLIDVALKDIATKAIKGMTKHIDVAAASALAVSAKKGFIPMLEAATPIGVIAIIAASGIENVKIIDRLMSGELTTREALDAMSRVSCAAVAGTYLSDFVGEAIAGKILTGKIVAGKIGMLLGSLIPVIGSCIGGMIAFMVGAEIGKMLCDVALKLRDAAWEATCSVWNAICDIGTTIANGVADLVESIFN